MNPSLDWLRQVAVRLGDLREDVVFLGGTVAGLLMTDPIAFGVRPTDDVDVIVEATTVTAEIALREQLRRLGFKEDTSEDAPLCRWIVDTIRVDIMPTTDAALGFSNRWYPAAFVHATPHRLDDLTTIRVVTAPFFLATKLEAFAGRGKNDYQASHDLEDMVALVDGRPQLDAEVAASGAELREYLAARLGGLLDEPSFQDALPGHLRPDRASQARRGLIIERLTRLAGRTA